MPWILIASLPQFVSAAPVSWACEFTSECYAGKCDTGRMNLTFFVEDSGRGNAYMQGNQGLVNVYPVIGEAAVSFIEPVTAGTVQATSILNDGTAVHSRHTQFVGQFVLSQWTGSCTYHAGN